MNYLKALSVLILFGAWFGYVAQSGHKQDNILAKNSNGLHNKKKFMDRHLSQYSCDCNLTICDGVGCKSNCMSSMYKIINYILQK